MNSSALQFAAEIKPLTGAGLTVRLLEAHGVTHIAGIPGGANLPLYDALVDSNIQHVLARHEQGAGFIAQGMARVTGQPQVCFASSGPGATNLVSAIADAKLDSIPLIAITGQVPVSLLGTDAFQEIDTFGLMLPITKHNYLVRSVDELPGVINEAFQIATEGRPGPVVIDIPKDVQLASVSDHRTMFDVDVSEEQQSVSEQVPSKQEIDEFLAMIDAAERPLLMIGGGAINAGCQDSLLQIIDDLQIPFVSTFMGLGVIPADHPLSLGMPGMHGAKYVHQVMEECDLLIGAGVRFDDRATGRPDAFCRGARIIHIDIDASEINKIKQADLAIHADLGETLRRVASNATPVDRPTWIPRVNQLRRQLPLPPATPGVPLHPYHLLPRIDVATDREATIVTDVGQHQMWTAQAFPFSRPRQWLSSGGLGTMGFGLPAAIGAALAEPNRPVVCISGDGSLMMNLQELDTLVELNLNVKVVVFNNQNLGLVRQQQTLFYEGRLKALGNRKPLRFASLAEAFGMPAVEIPNDASGLELMSSWLRKPGPVLIDVPIDPDERVFPMVPPGAANIDAIQP